MNEKRSLMKGRFNLDTALATWRRFLSHERAISAEDADELESHLRDEIEELVAAGCAEEEAFAEAVQRVGDYGVLDESYRDVHWAKLCSSGNLIEEITWRLSMWKKNLIIAFRNVKRHKANALINVFGLAVAVAAVLILSLFVTYERSFDHFHERADRIFALTEEATRGPGDVMTYRYTRVPALPAMLQEIPEVESGTRVQNKGPRTVSYENMHHDLDVIWVDSFFFDVFSFQVLQGNPLAALTRPDAVILTESAARKVFGDEDPVGETVGISYGEGTLTVEAVVADPPPNSTIQFEMIGSRLNGGKWFWNDETSWYNSNCPTFVLLREGVDPTSIAGKVDAFRAAHYEAYPGATVRLFLQPLTAIHGNETANGPLLAALTLIAVIILVIASINFTNLATAQALDRAREVGMRKVLGAQRIQLASQFLGESMLTCGFALVLGVGLAWLALPVFNGEMDLSLEFHPMAQAPALLVLWLLLAGIAGFYPAIYLSGLRPVESLRGRFGNKTGGQRLRQGLVVAQFGLAVFLIAGTLVVWQQINFMKSLDVHLDRENVLVTPVNMAALGGEEAAVPKLITVRDELLDQPIVRSATFAMTVPGRYNSDYNTYFVNGDQERGIRLRQVWDADARYTDTFGMKLVEGDGFSIDAPSQNEGRVVINQAAARILGESPADVRLVPGGGGEERLEIAGVVEDFYYESAASLVEPLIIRYGGEDPNGSNYLSVRLQPGKAVEGVALLEAYWNRLYPGTDFEYFFIDQEFDQLYRAQERLGVVATAFSLLAVLIACLGLMALTAFSVRLRTKEIGVRKVLGASVSQVVVLLSGDFARLVAVAAILAIPAIYIVMQRWLDDFANRIEVGPVALIGAGTLALLLAVITVGLQSMKAASANPVKSLRLE